MSTQNLNFSKIILVSIQITPLIVILILLLQGSIPFIVISLRIDEI